MQIFPCGSPLSVSPTDVTHTPVFGLLQNFLRKVSYSYRKNEPVHILVINKRLHPYSLEWAALSEKISKDCPNLRWQAGRFPVHWGHDCAGLHISQGVAHAHDRR